MKNKGALKEKTMNWYKNLSEIGKKNQRVSKRKVSRTDSV